MKVVARKYNVNEQLIYMQGIGEYHYTVFSTIDILSVCAVTDISLRDVVFFDIELGIDENV